MPFPMSEILETVNFACQTVAAQVQDEKDETPVQVKQLTQAGKVGFRFTTTRTINMMDIEITVRTKPRTGETMK